MSADQDITGLLDDWGRGDRHALDRLLPVIYAELRRIAARQLRLEREGHTLQPTALVHEAYLRLVEQRSVDWQSRAHFFGVAAQVMRRVLVDHARMRNYQKRGGKLAHVELDEAATLATEQAAELVALDEALDALARLDPRKSRVVELRYFGGLSAEETAEVLGVSEVTVLREWGRAKAWLRREMSGK